MFQFRHINRLKYPQKHVLICEDDLNCQKDILSHFANVFEPQGLVQFSVVAGSLAAAAIMSNCNIDVILLDHDMPQGNGADLLNWLKQNNKNIPVITFSGIYQNNVNMMAMGASHLFEKQEVISGKADDLIKKLLGLNIAEHYINTISPSMPSIARYWITPNILVGGNICNQQDWEHLERDFGIKAVINVDGQTNTDTTKTITHLLEFHVNDDGTPFPAQYIRDAIMFAKKHSNHPIYIHCHMGMSRSPHFAYAILRGCGMSQEEASSKILNSLPSTHNWGFNQHTISYMKSIEDALINWKAE